MEWNADRPTLNLRAIGMMPLQNGMVAGCANPLEISGVAKHLHNVVAAEIARNHVDFTSARRGDRHSPHGGSLQDRSRLREAPRRLATARGRSRRHRLRRRDC